MQPETREMRLKRLRYRANHRGIKEMDLIIGGFANTRLAELPDPQIDGFEWLLHQSDQDLLNWFTGETSPPPEAPHGLLQAISVWIDECGLAGIR